MGSRPVLRRASSRVRGVLPDPDGTSRRDRDQSAIDPPVVDTLAQRRLEFATSDASKWATPGGIIWATVPGAADIWAAVPGGAVIWAATPGGAVIWAAVHGGGVIWAAAPGGADIWAAVHGGAVIWAAAPGGAVIWAAAPGGADIWAAAPGGDGGAVLSMGLRG